MTEAQPAPTTPDPVPVTTGVTPVARPSLRQRVIWLVLASALGLVAVLELGPWPGAIVRSVGLAVAAPRSLPGDADPLPGASTLPLAPSYQSGSRVTFNDAEMATFARHCEDVWVVSRQLAEPRFDYRPVRDHYRSIVPQLFQSVMVQQFSTDASRRWQEFLEMRAPGRVEPPPGLTAFYEDLQRAVVTRDVRTGHLKELLRIIDRCRAEAAPRDQYRRAAVELGFVIPGPLQPRQDLRSAFPQPLLAQARDFIEAKLNAGDEPVTPPPAAPAPARPAEKPAPAATGNAEGGRPPF